MPHHQDPRFANVIGLGRLRRVFTYGAAYWGVAIFMLAFFAASVILHLTWSVYQDRCGRIELVATLVILPLLVWGYWRQRGDAVALYEGGIACASRSAVKQIAWAEMQTLREKVAWSSSADAEVASATYSIETGSGDKVDLPVLGRQNELWLAIQQAVTDLRLERDLDALRAGAVMDFGVFRLSSPGLESTRPGKTQVHVWSQIAKVELKRIASPLENVAVWLRSDDSAPTRWLVVGRAQIPNAHLFLALCRRLMEIPT